MNLKNILRKSFYRLPPNWRFYVRRLYYLPTDLFRSKDSIYPPKGLIFTGSGDFEQQGKKLLKTTIQYADLKPHHKVLDIGSGIGRFAIPLTNYLSKKGQYEGFDIIALGVNWCQKHIASKFSNFRFQYIPLENDLYRSSGAAATSFTFPYEQNFFDRIVLFSVFTHFQKEEVDNYLSEIHKVLRPDGICLATFFIIDHIEKRYKNPAFAFPYERDGYFLMDEKVEAANVAYSKNTLKHLVAKNNLEISRIYDGWWSEGEKKQHENFQDIVILRKRA